eukprot:14983666-Alexandrium_andersonii.AAC.1
MVSLPVHDFGRIKGGHVLAALRRNKCTAGGTDGWTPRELSALPWRACNMLACMYNAIEGGCPWPAPLTHAKCAMVSKAQ